MKIFLLLFLFSISTFANSDSISAVNVISNHLKAIGGIERLENTKDRIITMNGNFQGFNIIVTILQKNPNKFMQSSVFGSTGSYRVFDGTRGVKYIDSQYIEMSADENIFMKYDACLFLLLDYDKKGLSINYLGRDTVDSKNCYVVKVTSAEGNEWKYWFDEKDFMKLKEEKSIFYGEGRILSSTYYSSFKDFKGIKYPTVLKQKTGNEEYEFRITSIRHNTGVDDEDFVIEE